jgi:signal-transduction protein with cAMP-binding, CBS, and nucleotidyltransferase domain
VRAPFDALAPEELGELAAQTELEFYVAGAPILTEDGGRVTFLRVIHSGAVDIIHDGRLLDMLGAGDTFGHAAMLSGLPPGFEARAAEDTLCYRIPVSVARLLLDRVKQRSVEVAGGPPSHRPVATLLRSETVRCKPMESIREIARRMTAAGASSAIVDLREGGFGIVTDRDIRTKIVAAGLPLSAPVATVMTTPVGGDDELELSVLIERRALWGTPIDPLPEPEGPVRDAVVAALARRALAAVPPTGFDADSVLGADGRRSDLLDIRLAAVAPIVELARWGSAAAGVVEGSTPERLLAAAAGGVLSDGDARTLADAFDLGLELRIGHHMARIAAGRSPDDQIEPAEVSPLMRDHLRDVFRAVTAVQRRLRG